VLRLGLLGRRVRLACVAHRDRGTGVERRGAAGRTLPVKLPAAGFDGVLDGADIATDEFGNDHHVLGELRRDTERLGELPQQEVAVVEVCPNHHVLGVELTRDEPAVESPLGQAIYRSATNTGQRVGNAG
jgi:hypothetical protein